MMKLIDADKLHYKRVNISTGNGNVKSDVVVFAKEIDKAEVIDGAPVFTGEWTLCEDELPERNDEYYVAWVPKNKKFKLKRAFIGIVEFDEGKWVGDIPQAEYYGGFTILAWMELPEQLELFDDECA